MREGCSSCSDTRSVRSACTGSRRTSSQRTGPRSHWCTARVPPGRALAPLPEDRRALARPRALGDPRRGVPPRARAQDLGPRTRRVIAFRPLHGSCRVTYCALGEGMRHDGSGRRQHARWIAWTDSPLGSFAERVPTPDLLSEGPVRFLLVSGDQDDGAWGLVGSFWLSIDGERGGFFVSPQSLWRGSEMVRSFKSARARGWTDVDIYSYWQGQVGHLGLVHDRPAAARGQPVPGRSPRRRALGEPPPRQHHQPRRCDRTPNEVRHEVPPRCSGTRRRIAANAWLAANSTTSLKAPTPIPVNAASSASPHRTFGRVSNAANSPCQHAIAAVPSPTACATRSSAQQGDAERRVVEDPIPRPARSPPAIWANSRRAQEPQDAVGRTRC